MKNEKKEVIEDFAEVSERNYRPVEDDPTEKLLKAVCSGAAFGALAGLAVGQMPGNENVLFGYYMRDGGLALLGYGGAGVLLGALAGWIYARIVPRTERVDRIGDWQIITRETNEQIGTLARYITWLLFLLPERPQYSSVTWTVRHGRTGDVRRITAFSEQEFRQRLAEGQFDPSGTAG